jgi:hypothetical protein
MLIRDFLVVVYFNDGDDNGIWNGHIPVTSFKPSLQLRPVRQRNKNDSVNKEFTALYITKQRVCETVSII